MRADVSRGREGRSKGQQACELRAFLAATKDEPPKKKVKCDTQDGSVSEIISCEKLSDLHINFAQTLLKLQFPCVNGLQNTLLQSKNNPDKPLQDQLQVIHCCTRDHWIVASTVNCKDGEVNIYDSVYSTVDEETDKVLANLFHSSSVKVMQTRTEAGWWQRLWTVCHSHCYCYCIWS